MALVKDPHFSESPREALAADRTIEVIEQGYQRACLALGGEPEFAGFGFGGPVDKKTGSAKLALIKEFDDSVTPEGVSMMLGGLPVAHFNDVHASAHVLDFPHFTVATTELTQNPRYEPGASVLVEIGTGVGTAYCLPGGVVMPSEAVRIHASNGRPFGLNLCGSQGFVNITRELQEEGIKVPADLIEAIESGDTLGPTITKRIVAADASEFTEVFKHRYAMYLGEMLGMLQLAFLATRIFMGGSVGRAPGFLEKLLETDTFWNAFAKEDALRGRDMPLLRVNDTDATVRGAYAAAVKHVKLQKNRQD